MATTPAGSAPGPTRPTRRPRRSAAETREHVLAVAVELFHWHGIRATGIDEVAAAAEVAPTTLYRLFASKDDLIAAYVERAHDGYTDWLTTATAASVGPPRQRILALFDALAQQIRPEYCRGCPFLMTLAEFPDPRTAAHAYAVATKTWVRGHLHELVDALAAATPLPDPDSLADQLALVVDGVYASVQALGADGPATQAHAIAETLVDNACRRDESSSGPAGERRAGEAATLPATGAVVPGRPSLMRPGTRRKPMAISDRDRDRPRMARGLAGDFDYDAHGCSYSTVRRADPRIAAQVMAALGPGRSVINVGAGAGSYEPDDRHTVAVEPSTSMRSQRPPTAVPAIDATAEALPFDDDSVDAAMATVTVHQWRDLDRGLLEMRRVSRGPVVVLTFDGEALDRLWLAEYVPELIAAERGRYPALGHIADVLGGHTQVSTISIPVDCTDGFTEAFYARPERFLDPTVRASQSAWGFVAPDVVTRAVDALRHDLDDGAWDRRHGHLRTQPEFVGALRLVVARP